MAVYPLQRSLQAVDPSTAFTHRHAPSVEVYSYTAAIQSTAIQQLYSIQPLQSPSAENKTRDTLTVTQGQGELTL